MVSDRSNGDDVLPTLKERSQLPDQAFAVAREHRQRGDTAAAEAIYRKILDAMPEHADSLHALAVIEFERGLQADGLARLRRAIAQEPLSEKFHMNLGILLQRMGRLQEAQAAHLRAIDLAPENAQCHFNLGLALQKQKRWSKAEEAYKRAIELAPIPGRSSRWIFHTFYNLGTVFEELERLGEAASAYRRCVDLAPKNPRSHFKLGIVLRKLSKLDAAIQVFDRALALEPKSVSAHSHRGFVLQRQSRLEEAEAAYQRALEFDPNDIKARCHLSMVHKFVPGDPEIDAIKAQLARTDITDAQRSGLMTALGNAYQAIGRYDDAFTEFRRANDMSKQQTSFELEKRRTEVEMIKRGFEKAISAPAGSRAHADIVPIFVVGMSCSGKTLVENLLGGQPGVCTMGEWLGLRRAIDVVCARHGINATYPGCVDQLNDVMFQEIGQSYLDNIAVTFPGYRYYVATFPGYSRYIGLIFRAFTAPRLIFCQRDPMDNCFIIYSHIRTHGKWYNYDLETLGKHYALNRDLMAHWKRLFGAQILDVCYEDFVRDPQAIGKQICDFCGIDHDPDFIQHPLWTDEIGRSTHYIKYLGALQRVVAEQSVSVS
jgi:tetratricopeptide (TPR) repeat protein